MCSDGGISSAGSQSSMLQLDEAIKDNLEEPSQSKGTKVPKGTSQRLVPANQFLQNRTSYTLEGAEKGAGRGFLCFFLFFYNFFFTA